MKYLISSILLLTSSFFAKANEVTYRGGTWEEIKAKAKTEHKYIMVDCYTDWCGWCKVMDKKTMPDEGVIALLNDKFIPVKMEMEHGEGMKLAMKYHISGFPTFMFFNPDGELVYESVGYEQPREFLEELNHALDKEKQFHATGYSASIDIAFPEFYQLAFAAKKKFPEVKDVEAFLDKQTDLLSEISWGVLSKFDAGEKYSKFFFDNYEKYKTLYGSYTVDHKVMSTLNNRMKDATKNQDKEQFDEILKMVDKYVSNDATAVKIDFRIDYCKGTNDWNSFFDALSDFIKQNGYTNAEFINSNCWTAYENCSDKQLLMKACSFMDKVIAQTPQYPYMDTYTALLYKTGQMKDAETWANKAIAMGKKGGDDVSATEELLKKIKGGK